MGFPRLSLSWVQALDTEFNSILDLSSGCFVFSDFQCEMAEKVGYNCGSP